MSVHTAHSALYTSLQAMAGARVLVLGDIMVDEYMLGDAERISPEAPVPVVLIEQEQYMLGGAGNVARNIASLSGDVLLFSACGNGHNRERLEALLQESNINTRLLDLPGRPVTTKTRVLARQQQVLRIDHEHAQSLTPDDGQKLCALLEASLTGNDVLILSDYCKGCITQQIMQAITALRARHPALRVLVDPKVPNYPLYKGVDLLTPNSLETSLGAGLPTRNREEIIAAGRVLFKKLQCRQLLTTLGAHGMALFVGPDEIYHLPTQARNVFDVTGAGDTVIAALALALAAGLDAITACTIANQAAGIVVGEVGTAVTTLDAIEDAFRSWGVPQAQSWTA